jgi:hypothetical protein
VNCRCEGPLLFSAIAIVHSFYAFRRLAFGCIFQFSKSYYHPITCRFKVIAVIIMILPFQSSFHSVNSKMKPTAAPIQEVIVVVHKLSEEKMSHIEHDDDLTIGSHSPSLRQNTFDEDDDGYGFYCQSNDSIRGCPVLEKEANELRWSSEQVPCTRPRSNSCSPSMPVRNRHDSSSCMRWSSFTKKESASDLAPIMPSRTRPRSKSESSAGKTNRAIENTKALGVLPAPPTVFRA